MNKRFKKLKADVIRWKQFSRRGDAIFRSLGREIVISVLSIVTLSFAVPTTSQAQTVTNPDSAYIEEDTLQEVVVTAAKVPLPMEQTARIVSVITHEQIMSCSAQSLNDVLKYSASVDVRQRGGYGIQTDISINGGTHDQIILLIDGINISSPHTGHLSTDFPLSTDDIERIEVLEGAASRVYGTSAFSGAINIITRKHNSLPQSDKWNVSTGIKVGSYGTVGVNGSVGYNSNNCFHGLSTSFTRSDGATDNSEFHKYNVFYHGDHKNASFNLNWHLGANIQRYGATTFYSGKYPDQYEENQKYLGALSIQTKGKIVLKSNIYFTKAFDHYQLIKHSSFGENHHTTDVYGTSVNASTKWALGTTLVSADLRNEGILSTSLGKPLEESEYVKIPGSKHYYTNKDNRTNVTYFLEHDVVVNDLTLSFGMMSNMNTSLNHKFRVYPGIDISYRPSSHLKLFASWNTAQRMPTFTDFYYKSPTQEGNIGIKPEKTSELSVSASHRVNGIMSDIRLFYRHDSPLIDWVLTKADSENGFTTYHAANFKIDKAGINLKSRLLFDELIDDDFLIRSLSIDYTYLKQKRHDNIEVVASTYALDYLRQKLVIDIDAKIWSKLSLNATLRYHDRQGGFVEYVSNVRDDGSIIYDASFEKFKPFAIISAKLLWKDQKKEMFVECENLSNIKYYDIGNVEQPGLLMMAGIKLHF